MRGGVFTSLRSLSWHPVFSYSHQLKLLYVAITRARESLWIVDSSERAVPIEVRILYSLQALQTSQSLSNRCSGRARNSCDPGQGAILCLISPGLPQPMNGRKGGNLCSTKVNLNTPNSASSVRTFKIAPYKRRHVDFGLWLPAFRLPELEMLGFLKPAPCS